MSELHQELEKIHLEIARILGMDRDNLRFEYTQQDEKNALNLVTINPRHKQSFLFHTSVGFGEMDALQKMLEYVKMHKRTDSYTIQWSIRNTGELHTSYFRGKNMYEGLDKFYFGKDINGTVIFSISLNPIS